MLFGYVFGGLAVVCAEVNVSCSYHSDHVVRIRLEELFDLLWCESASWLVIAWGDENIGSSGAGVWGYGEGGVGDAVG